MEINIKLPAVKLGTIEADAVRVAPSDQALAQLMDEVCERKRREFTLESLADSKPVRDVRAMFREWGMDPSKYRPASEALLRRVVQGKGLYRVSNVVDIGNLGSIETGWPFGCYDRSRIQQSIEFRHGVAGESYEGIGKQTWHLQGRPLLADSQEPFGQPHKRFHAQHDHGERQGYPNRSLRTRRRCRGVLRSGDKASHRASHTVRQCSGDAFRNLSPRLTRSCDCPIYTLAINI